MKIPLSTADEPVAVTKILCIGRNYAKHAAEMKSDVPDEPLVFLKPPSALVEDGGDVILPARSGNVHHEIELVVVIGKAGKNISQDVALDYVDAYAIGLDMTARDLQREAKVDGRPWSVAKGFDTFAPLGERVPAHTVSDPQDLALRLTVNGAVRQEGHTHDMIFPVAALITYCSRIFTLAPGDLIYTGTPEGVGPVRDGDRLEATVGGLPALHVGVKRET